MPARTWYFGTQSVLLSQARDDQSQLCPGARTSNALKRTCSTLRVGPRTLCAQGIFFLVILFFEAPFPSPP
jgi:hypothetical protein